MSEKRVQTLHFPTFIIIWWFQIFVCSLQEELYLKRVSELDEITDIRNEQRRQHDDLRKRRLDEFMAGFTVITTRLKEMYQMITLGGDAELELVDSLDPFSEGIVFRYLYCFNELFFTHSACVV